MPGPQTGGRGEPTATEESQIPPFSEWFPAFLRDELKPYPGRGILAMRYVLAATLTMLVIMTFRLPGAAVGGFYSLLLPRESLTTTARSALAILTSFGASFVFSLVGAMLFVDYPLTHFLWVIVSFFVAFFALSTMSNYAAASAFAILIVLAVPAWDVPVPTSAVVVTNLWTAGSVAVALGATLVVEYTFAFFDSSDPYELGLDERVEAVATYLDQWSRGVVTKESRDKVRQLAMVSVTRLRRIALSSNTSEEERARRSTVVSLVGRLVDIAAVLVNAEHACGDDAAMLAGLARDLRRYKSMLSQPGDQVPALEMPDRLRSRDPLLVELDTDARSLRFSLTSKGREAASLDRAHPPSPPLLVADAFTNPDHLHFALRGCLAAVICYFLMNAVAWPGLGPSLFTCVVTALTSIGSSRQKQLLRVCGAIVGGVIFGMGSQVFIVPMLDGIAGFLVMFMVVTAIAAWFLTASPRLSYFGSQMALAFFLIHLRSPAPQTNVAIARDNVMGILLGLIVMWLVFEPLGAKPAIEVMRELFAANLKLMSKLADPWPDGHRADLGKLRAMRDKISQNFSAVNAQADAVLFELGRGRDASLRLRNRLLTLQPSLRTLFLLQVALLQYRVHVHPNELPTKVRKAQANFDNALHELLSGLSERFLQQGRKAPATETVRQRFKELCDSADQTYGSEKPQRAVGVLALASQIVRIASIL